MLIKASQCEIKAQFWVHHPSLVRPSIFFSSSGAGSRGQQSKHRSRLSSVPRHFLEHKKVKGSQKKCNYLRNESNCIAKKCVWNQTVVLFIFVGLFYIRGKLLRLQLLFQTSLEQEVKIKTHCQTVWKFSSRWNMRTGNESIPCFNTVSQHCFLISLFNSKLLSFFKPQGQSVSSNEAYILKTVTMYVKLCSFPSWTFL